MNCRVLATVLSLSLLQVPLPAERINQEGRILGPAPIVANAVLFNTAEADAILAAMQIFPVTNAWNEDISRRPLLANSDAMIAQIMADLDPTRRTLRAFQEMNFVLVPDKEPLVTIDFVDYPEESDPGPYPIPANMPIETWPSGTGSLTLQQWQQDINNDGGDRHSIIVQPGTWGLWETWQAKLVGSSWQASNGAKFDLGSNALRPAGWTSGDAAGLPMFPALPRFDECERGMVEHACRLVVKRTRKQYLYPANHYASTTSATQTNVPAMGQRLRLKSSFPIPPTWAKEEKAILLALKKYGAIVADNGGFFSISVTPDDRWPAAAFSHLSSVSITNFEVIQTTGPTEGPRSSGAPQTDAGPNLTAQAGAVVPLQGWVSFGGSTPTNQWRVYSGPGPVTFADPSRTNTTASFSAAGTYTLMLSADDGVHAVAYDAVMVTVNAAISVAWNRTGNDLALSWTGGTAPYVVEHRGWAATNIWQALITTNGHAASIPLAAGGGVVRVRGY